LNGLKVRGYIYFRRSLRGRYISITIVHGEKKRLGDFWVLNKIVGGGRLENEQSTADNTQQNSASSSEEVD